MVDLSTEEVRREYGTATLDPTDDIVAGSYETWSISYTAGALGIDEIGRAHV